MPARPGRTGRVVRLAVRFTKVELQRPARGADPRDPKTASVYAVDAREVDPPINDDAIHWRLLTTHAITTFSDAIAAIDLYGLRWLIEQLFRTLKSQAIDIESGLLADGSALEALVATASIAATIVMQLVQARGEAGWTRPAAQVFTSTEIIILKIVVPQLEGKTAKQRNPHPEESLAWAAWAIARLGGWSGYASERPPGPITFAIGLQRFKAMAEGFALGQKTTQ